MDDDVMTSNDSLDARMGAAVSQLELLEGVRTWPGASEIEIARAERELDVTFPADFRAFLRRTNGLELMSGRERVFGIGDGAPLNLAWFNHPDTWRWAWPDRPDLDDLVIVGMTDTPGATAYKRSELQTRQDASLHGGPIDLPGYLTWSSRLIDALEGPWQAMAAGPPDADPVLGQYIKEFGHVPMDQAVVPGPRYFFPPYDERREHEGATLVNIDWAMISFADLLRSADEVLAEAGDAPVAVQGVEIWTDDAGRSRLRWVAERLPSTEPDGS